MKTIPLEELIARHLTPAQARRAERKTQKLLEQMELREIREALKITQRGLARSLKVAQPTLAKIEKQPDMQVATLRKVVRALGGDIEIIARFPQADVRIKMPSRKRVRHAG